MQVSFDNGTQWIDVTVNNDGSWQAVDLLEHTASWNILTRVIDSVGNATSLTRQVTLDTLVEAPTSLTWDGIEINVSFNAAGAVMGDKLLINVDGEKFYHSLSQGEIDNGVATIAWNAVNKGSAQSITAAYIDIVDNISSAVQLKLQPITAKVEDFESQIERTFVNGEKIVMSNFTLDVVNRGSSYFSGFSKHQNWADPSPTMALNIGWGSKVLMELATHDSNYIAMTVGDLNLNEEFIATFYDQHNNEIHRAQLTPTSAGLRSDITYELPFGMTFSSVTLELTAGGVWIDNVTLGRYEYSQSPDFIDPELEQNLGQSDVAMFGDELDNIFTLVDVSLLNGAENGIHGNDGLDTLKLTGAGQTLDLSDLGNKISSIEIFDIAGSGNNTLTIGIADVLAQGETGLFIDNDKVQVMVKGNAGDQVNLSDLLPGGADVGDWNLGGSVSVGGVSYQVYELANSDAELLIQQDITVNVNNH